MPKNKKNKKDKKENKDKEPQDPVRKAVKIDYTNEPLPEHHPPETIHRLRTNHLELQYETGYKLYRYNIGKIVQVKAKDSKSDTSKQQSDIAKLSLADKDANADEQEDAGLTGRKRGRLIHLLINALQDDEGDVTITSNYVDQLISGKPLSSMPKDVLIEYFSEDDDGPGEKTPIYNVSIGPEDILEVERLNSYIGGWQTLEGAKFDSVDEAESMKNKVLDALNIVFSHYANRCTFREVKSGGSKDPETAFVASNKFFNLPRGPFKFGNNQIPPFRLNENHHLAALPGFFRSARIGFNADLSININPISGAFWTWKNLKEVVNGLPGGFREKESMLKGLRVRTLYMVQAKKRKFERIYTIAGLPHTALWHATDPEKRGDYPLSGPNGKVPFAERVTFPIMEKDPVTKEDVKKEDRSVKDHFNTLNIKIASGELVVRLGEKGPLVPVSQLEILPGQFWRNKTEMPEIASNTPQENHRRIVTDAAALFGFGSKEKEILEEPFKLNVDKCEDGKPRLMEVKANIISRPQIEYKGKASVEDAQWNLIDRKPHNAPSTGTWTLLELYRHGEKQNPETVKKFFEEFDAALKAYSMSGLSSKAGQMKQVVIDQKSPELTRENFRKEINELTKSSEHEFTVVLLPERDQDLYAMVKDVADRELGHVTACCVRKKGEIPTSRPTLASIIMKINLKLNKESVDRKIKSLSTYKLLDGETMIVGMDVTHPGGGALEEVPSVAAVVASIDHNFAVWPTSLRENFEIESPPPSDKKGRVNRKKPCEKIMELQDMLEDRLKAYQESNNQKLPKNIIFYRDGLSKGQFRYCQEGGFEVRQIEQALTNMYGKQKAPGYMVICAVKHYNAAKKKSNKAAGNPQAGVVIYDPKVTEGRSQDFFLVSQKALLGTVRPTHYVVLHNTFDQKTYNVEDVAAATYALCYLFGRCTSSVGLVTPAYLADKACDRARCYVRDLYTGNTPFKKYNNGSVDNFKNRLAFHPKFKDKMFYI